MKIKPFGLSANDYFTYLCSINFKKMIRDMDKRHAGDVPERADGRLSKMYKDYFLTKEAYIKNKTRTEKKIKAYKSSFMSNTKWRKLFLTIYLNHDLIKSCEIIDFFSSTYVYLRNDLKDIDFDQYINTDCIDNYLITGEYTVSFKEIEYIEFKKQWKEKTGTEEEFEQNIKKIKEIIMATGKYEFEETENYLRIYGYK
jgi:hypothetical protein